MIQALHLQMCAPCLDGDTPLKESEATHLQGHLHKDWEIIDNHHLTRHFIFKDFAEALTFVNKVGEIAEVNQHHPNISFTWGKVDIAIYTHKINGLRQADFVLAAKIDRI